MVAPSTPSRTAGPHHPSEVAPTLPGPVSWSIYSFANRIPPIGFAAVTSFSVGASGYVEVVGGSGGCGAYCADSYELQLNNPNGATWIQLGAPWKNGTVGSSVAWDAADGQLVLFGGLNGTYGPLNDTWTLDPHLQAWSPLPPGGPSPSPRWASSMAYDPALGGLLLFGGAGARGAPLGDTWLYRQDRWTRLSTGQSPPARSGASMGWQADQERMVLFGGNGSSGALNDTWAFSGGTWYPLHPSVSPPARANASSSPDAEGDLVLFGGFEAGGDGSDVWILQSDNWTSQTAEEGGVSPGPLDGGALVPDLGTSANTLLLIDGDTPGGPVPFTYALYVNNGGVPPAPLPLTLSAETVPTSGLSPLTVHGSAVGTEGTPPFYYAWIFGDGSATDFAPSPTHVFVEPGDYLAVVEIHDSALPPATLYETLPVAVAAPASARLHASFNATPPTGPLPLNVSFQATASGGTGNLSFAWRFGDGTLGSGGTSVTHTFDTQGIYPVRLWVNSSSGQTASWIDTILAGRLGPSVELSASPTEGLPPLEVHLEALPSNGPSPYVYLWSFGDGNATLTALQNLTYWYNVTGNYTLTVTVIDGLGESANASVLIRVGVVPPFVPPPPTLLERLASAVGAGIGFLLEPLVLGTILLVVAVGSAARWTILDVPLQRAVRRGAHRRPMSERWGLAEVAWLLSALRQRTPLAEGWGTLRPLLERDTAALARRLTPRPGPGLVWVVRRCLLLIPQLLIAATVLFLGFEALPAWVSRIPGRLQPGPVGFVDNWWSYVSALFTGGYTSPQLLAYLPFSLQFLLVIVVLSAVVSYPLGLLAGWYRGRVVDQSSRVASSLAFGLPVYVVALLTIGGVWLAYYDLTNGDTILGSLPSVLWEDNNLGGIPNWVGELGNTSPTGFVLLDAPLHGAWTFEAVVLCKMILQGLPLALVYSGIFLRYARSATQEAANDPHIVAGRARGLSDRQLLWRHTSRRVSPVYVAIFGTTFPTLLFLQMFAEWFYNDMGIGVTFLDDVGLGDPTALGQVAFIMLLLIFVVNAVGDGLSRALDRAGWTRGG